MIWNLLQKYIFSNIKSEYTYHYAVANGVKGKDAGGWIMKRWWLIVSYSRKFEELHRDEYKLGHKAIKLKEDLDKTVELYHAAQVARQKRVATVNLAAGSLNCYGPHFKDKGHMFEFAKSAIFPPDKEDLEKAVRAANIAGTGLSKRDIKLKALEAGNKKSNSQRHTISDSKANVLIDQDGDSVITHSAAEFEQKHKSQDNHGKGKQNKGNHDQNKQQHGGNRQYKEPDDWQ